MRGELIGIALLAAATGAAAQQGRSFEFHRDVPVGARLFVRNIIGDVRIEAGSGRRFDVQATKKAGHHGEPEDVTIRAVDVDGGVAICVDYPSSGRRTSDDRDDRDRERTRARRDSAERDDEDSHGSRRHNDEDVCNRNHGGNWNNNIRNDTEVTFTIRVPADVKLDAKTVSGDLLASGLRGTLDLGSVSGDVRLTDAEGDVINANTVSGEIELTRVRGTEVSAETVSGDVTFEGTIAPKGRYDFKTLSGDVELKLPGRPDAEFRGTTFSGGVDTDWPVSREGKQNRHRLTATWGQGGAQIDVESFSGDVRVRQAGR